jgi:hypothetical protein
MEHRSGKILRRDQLTECLRQKPLLTDQDLAAALGVSVQTIRLDRLSLGIPELRERARLIAESVAQKISVIPDSAPMGELLELQMGGYAVSALEVEENMVSPKNKICGADFLFSQANTLAAALIDADVVLTGSARIRFRRPVYLHERVMAHAVLKKRKMNKNLVKVVGKVGALEVYTAQVFMVER